MRSKNEKMRREKYMKSVQKKDLVESTISHPNAPNFEYYFIFLTALGLWVFNPARLLSLILREHLRLNRPVPKKSYA